MADPLVPSWAAAVFRRRFSQPDQTTCGPTCLVVARILADQEYAGEASEPETFRAEVLALHQKVTSLRDTLGPHAAALAARSSAPRPGRWPARWRRSPAMSFDSDLVVSGRGSAYDRIAAATAEGHRVPVFVGNRWLPRHVVLALGVVDDALRFYEPAKGRLVDVTRDVVRGRAAGSGRLGPAVVRGAAGLADRPGPWPSGRRTPAA